jgi:hypothetical protein
VKTKRTTYRCVFNGRQVGTRTPLHRIIDCVQATDQAEAETIITKRYECVHYLRALPITLARRIDALTAN